MKNSHYTFAGTAGLVCAVSLAAVAAVLVLSHRDGSRGPGHLRYVASGYGGYIYEPAAPRRNRSGGTRTPVAATAVRAMFDAYNRGSYGAAEARASAVLSATASSQRTVSATMRAQAAEARLVLAYSAARRHNLTLARARFSMLESAAAGLPGGGVQRSADPNLPTPTMLQEAAYDHAVCTGALGDKTGAEREYMSFMNRFPDSPLVSGAYQRISRLHGGKAPAAADAALTKARRIADADSEKVRRQESLCGPECAAQMLRRHGRAVSVERLADEMHTSSQGTSLESVASSLANNGLKTQGFQLTQKGLASAPLPLVALIKPGHYVIVDAVSHSAVRIFDPDARGVGKGAERDMPVEQWQKFWTGVALVPHN